MYFVWVQVEFDTCLGLMELHQFFIPYVWSLANLSTISENIVSNVMASGR